MHLLSTRSGFLQGAYSYAAVEKMHGISELYGPETDLVVQFQAAPVRLELLKTVFTHLADTIETTKQKRVKQQNPVRDC
jgi:hypothetical protein